MKKLIILLILAVLIVNPISAKTIEENLYEGDNIEIPGHNITLMGVGSDKKSIVTCINNEIYMLDKGNKRELGNLKIEPIRIYDDYVKLQLTYSEESICDELCSNTLCYGGQSLEPQNNESNPQNQQGTNQDQQGEESTQQEKKGVSAFNIILFLIVLILLIILLTKKKR